jgi:hypothetical protein
VLVVDAFFGLIAVTVVAVFGLVAFVVVRHFKQARKRREDLALWAVQHGFEYSQQDPHGLVGLDFHLFGLGDGRGCENVLTGTWEGLPVHLADYWYYEDDNDSRGRSSRSYQLFSVMLTKVGADLPHVRIGQENVLSRLFDKLGFDDVQFESEQFNRRFRVHADDRRFAYQLVDARMMDWLLTPGSPHCYEVNGQWVLVHGKRLPPEQLTSLLQAGKGFVEQVPRLVWEDYGTEKEGGS